jgi:hypothetical protein
MGRDRSARQRETAEKVLSWVRFAQARPHHFAYRPATNMRLSEVPDFFSRLNARGGRRVFGAR